MIRNIVPILFAAIAMVSSPQAASQALPPAGPSTSMPPSAPASVATPAPPASGADPRADFKIPVGWRVKMLRGEEPRYCRKDVRLGSRFAKEECLTRDQLQLRLQLDADNASRVSQGARICSSAPGCANN
ncbi:MAG: hypothetical protein RL580_1473 [Pseudomonadota bacterium]|jgi:hypothetical protein